MSDKNKNVFERQINRLKRVLKVSTDIGLGKALGISHQAVTAARRRNRIPLKWFIRLQEKYQLSANFILKGAEEQRTISAGDDDDFNRFPKCTGDTPEEQLSKCFRKYIRAKASLSGIKLTRNEIDTVYDGITDGINAILEQIVLDIDELNRN
jgi:hypothetical protein